MIGGKVSMLMFFAVLCFGGLFVMFYIILRNMDKMLETMRDEHAQLRVLARSLESKFETRQVCASEITGPAESEKKSYDAGEVLDKLDLSPAAQPEEKKNPFELKFNG